QRPSRGGRCIQTLLMQVEIDTLRVHLPQEGDEVLQRPAQPVNRPRRHKVELSSSYSFAERVEGRPLVSALGPTDTLVGEDLDGLPAMTQGDCLKLTPLIFY